MEYNGGAVVAMTGKNCVAIASDHRFGIQFQTLACDMPKVHRIHDKCYVGLSGLVTDMQTFRAKIDYRVKMYELREERRIKPSVFANMVSTMLYERRFGPYFVEPLIAGLERKVEEDGSVREDVPFICATDLIGAAVYTNDFLVGGTSSDKLYGVCEAMYKPDQEPDDLFETISQALLAAVDRDCLAGWGATVHIMSVVWSLAFVLSHIFITVLQLKSSQRPSNLAWIELHSSPSCVACLPKYTVSPEIRLGPRNTIANCKLSRARQRLQMEQQQP